MSPIIEYLGSFEPNNYGETKKSKQTVMTNTLETKRRQFHFTNTLHFYKKLTSVPFP